MKMPVFSYFLVVGIALTGALLLLSNYIEPYGRPFSGSQMVGVAKPFKPEPERSPYEITAVNFAASRSSNGAARQNGSAKNADREHNAARAARRKDVAAPTTSDSRWNRVAANPYDDLMRIH
ncbi:MAG TPA: hypothetical protein VIV34_09200 [Pseudolabrys sp.]